MKNCNKIRELLSDYLDNNNAVKAEVEIHLRECRACSEEYHELKKIAELSSELEDEELPEGFEVRLHKALVLEVESSQKNKWKRFILNNNTLKVCSSIAAGILLIFMVNGIWGVFKNTNHSNVENISLSEKASDAETNSENPSTPLPEYTAESADGTAQDLVSVAEATPIEDTKLIESTPNLNTSTNSQEDQFVDAEIAALPPPTATGSDKSQSIIAPSIDSDADSDVAEYNPSPGESPDETNISEPEEPEEIWDEPSDEAVDEEPSVEEPGDMANEDYFVEKASVNIKTDNADEAIQILNVFAGTFGGELILHETNKEQQQTVSQTVVYFIPDSFAVEFNNTIVEGFKDAVSDFGQHKVIDVKAQVVELKDKINQKEAEISEIQNNGASIDSEVVQEAFKARENLLQLLDDLLRETRNTLFTVTFN